MSLSPRLLPLLTSSWRSCLLMTTILLLLQSSQSTFIRYNKAMITPRRISTRSPHQPYSRPHRQSSIPLSSSSSTWYSDSSLRRGNNPETKTQLTKSSLILVAIGEKPLIAHLLNNHDSSAEGLFLTPHQAQRLVGGDDDELWRDLSHGIERNGTIMVHIGDASGISYHALRLSDHYFQSTTTTTTTNSSSSELLLSTLHSILPPPPNDQTLTLLPLREFGDRLLHSLPSAIHATANALLLFHSTHPFCPRCGHPLHPSRHGSCRRCPHPQCPSKGRSLHPRIDVAAIVLVTSPDGTRALLGRKRNWPAGRYSTLAGFLEVGETMEECVAREVYEESGVGVERGSLRFVASQPWPFPRSLMMGFRGRAAAVVEGGEREELPSIVVNEGEMEDVRWFHRDFVRERLEGGSTALEYDPRGEERLFHIPGKASLARVLITEWALEG